MGSELEKMKRRGKENKVVLGILGYCLEVLKPYFPSVTFPIFQVPSLPLLNW